MKIKEIKIGKICIPLKKAFKTVVTTVDEIHEIVVKIISDDGHIGYGCACPASKTTGDIENSIISSINFIKPELINKNIDNIEEIMAIINNTIIGNFSAKAALDIAIYDLFGQKYNLPLYKLFGGSKKRIVTDITISVNSPEEMVKDSLEAIRNGFSHLKVKVGSDPKLDFARVKAIRQAVRKDTKIRVDANQGWTAKEAVRIITKFEDAGLDIEFIEQPVKAWDIEGLKFVTDNVLTDILADESVHSPQDAFKVIQMRAADLINIKLMKCGGFHNALKICNIAEIMDVECMMGCMIESKIGATAAASFSMGRRNITKSDLDTIMLFDKDPIDGGANFENDTITASDAPGLGINNVDGWKEIFENV